MVNIDKDNEAPANGPDKEISTFVFRSGRMDLNYKRRQRGKNVENIVND